MKTFLPSNTFANQRILFLFLFMLGFSFISKAQIQVLPGTSVTQNFDEIGSSAGAVLPVGWRADNLTSLRTVGSYHTARTTTTQAASTAMSVHGIYNFGSTATVTDRAIGGLCSSTDSRSVNVYVALKNTGVGSIRDFTISYQVEKYRNGTNPAGFTVQLYYSTTGEAGSWTSAGEHFRTSFAGSDANISGSGPTGAAPLATSLVTDKTLSLPLAADQTLYLAWNYAVTTGSTTTNAQALGIDDISITANDAASLAPSLSTPTITQPAPHCAGSTIVVLANSTGTFNASNTFTAQLSDASGNFTQPLATASGSSPLEVRIPANALQGSGYKVRVVASSPSASSPETSPFTINGSPADHAVTVSPSAGQTVGVNGTGASLTATALAASGFRWFTKAADEADFKPIAGATGAMYTPRAADLGPPGAYMLLVQARTICGDKMAQSQLIPITVSAPVMAVSLNQLEFGYAEINQTAAFPVLNLVVSGNFLTDHIILTIPSATGFRLRVGSSANFVQSVSLPVVNGTVAATTVQVRFEPVAVQAYASSLQITTAGATTMSMPLTGAGSERPSVTTAAVSTITAAQAIAGGEVKLQPNDAPVTARGVVYGTSGTNLTINWSAHTTTTDGTGPGIFSSVLSNLVPATTYFVRAYATNGAGTAYGATHSFTTPAVELATRPTTPPAISLAKASHNQLRLQLQKGDGVKTLVFARASQPVTAVPTDGVSYSALSTFGAGTQIGTGNFVVYNGEESEFTLKGLAPNTSYQLAAFAYNDNQTPYAEAYLTSSAGTLEVTTSPAPGQLLFEDAFEAPVGTSLTSLGWSVHSGAETNALKLVSSALAYPGYGSSGLGNAVYLNLTGQDVNRAFDPVLPNTPIYTACLVNVASANSTGDFFLHFGNTNTQFRSRVFIKASTVTGTVNFGISGSTNTATYAAGNYPVGTTLLLVVKFEFGAQGNKTTLYVNPNNLFEENTAEGISVTEAPTSGNATPNISVIALRQGTASYAPRLTLDGLRVATSYDMALGNILIAGSENTLSSGNYHAVTVNGDANALELTGPVTIHGSLTLNGGHVISAPEKLLTLGANTTVTGGGRDSFIQGPVKILTAKQQASLFFPIGDADAYNPVILNVTQQEATLSGYTAVYKTGAARTRTLPGSINTISEEGHFTISPDNPENVKQAFVSLPYGTHEPVPAPWNLRILKSSGDDWLDLGAALQNETASTGVITSVVPFQSFSDFVLATTNEVSLRSMPVELLSFTGKRVGKAVELSWKTASEKDNKHFEVQRSNDGLHFTTTSIIRGKGTTLSVSTYSATDVHAPGQVVYYRLKQVDTQGTYTISAAIAVGPAATIPVLTLFPNPTTGLLYLHTEYVDLNTILEIHDMLGQTVLSTGIKKIDGTHTLDVHQLPAGTYSLTLRSEHATVKGKFIKVR
ncbi:T9SS type A sorting domain-containing protein [Pontibacter qinzhouensis]|uniref:T9SS type A sorting domain-containing protein n=1 Tax=Pontibacter qinzhouensis TaxID=2603253 RepID=A0A5C8JE39_9BACT|nr:T9SS type A sorting domain-containing protein [Pontibacter qinzhouensis]TXK36600.1 T9SS type A sorting domain-containing protein [Pontibacter qinzhouensis]